MTNALLALLLVAAVLLAPQLSVTLSSSGPVVTAKLSAAGVTAPEVEREVERAAKAAPKPLWPGFDPLAVPLAVYDGNSTWLFRHPAPPASFQPAGGSEAGVVAEGRHEAVTANTNAEIGGVSTATVLIDRKYPGCSPGDIGA